MIIIYTGDGKGKTTAAIGTCFRAMGYGWKVAMVQFMKGTWHYGELDTVNRLSDLMEIIPMGKGFYKILDDSATEEEHMEAAENAFSSALGKIHSGSYRLIVLDEVLVAVQTGLLDEAKVLEGLRSIPENVHVILTGRGATDSLKDMADLVTEMCEIKHPFQKGIMAVEGIDF